MLWGKWHNLVQSVANNAPTLSRLDASFPLLVHRQGGRIHVKAECQDPLRRNNYRNTSRYGIVQRGFAGAGGARAGGGGGILSQFPYFDASAPHPISIPRSTQNLIYRLMSLFFSRLFPFRLGESVSFTNTLFSSSHYASSLAKRPACG